MVKVSMSDQDKQPNIGLSHRKYDNTNMTEIILRDAEKKCNTYKYSTNVKLEKLD
jgi:hypothetical protein